MAPEYPKDAKAAHICGTILLHAVIAKDGTMQQLEYISGPRLLLHSAMEAVRQWRYKPTLLNGQPVEVDTKISVVYTMGKSCDDTTKDSGPEKKSLLIEPAPGRSDARISRARNNSLKLSFSAKHYSPIFACVNWCRRPRELRFSSRPLG